MLHSQEQVLIVKINIYEFLLKKTTDVARKIGVVLRKIQGISKMRRAVWG